MVTENVGRGQTCKYFCETNGACRVKFQSNSFFNGKTGGSCSPKRFGGGCSGTPDKCSDCNQKVVCEVTKGVTKTGDGSYAIKSNVLVPKYFICLLCPSMIRFSK